MLRKLRAAEWLLALGTAVLFASTFAKWFSLPVGEALDLVAPDAQQIGSSAATGLNVWDLSVTRWFVYLALLSAALLVVAATFGETAHYAVVMGTPTVLFGFLAVVGLLVRLIWPPLDSTVEPAYYAAVAGSLLLFCAGCWSLRSEYVPDAYKSAPEPERVHLDSAP